MDIKKDRVMLKRADFMEQDKVYLAGPSVSAAGCQNLFQTHRDVWKCKREGHGRRTAGAAL